MSDDGASPAFSIIGLDFFPRQWQAVTADVGPVLVLAGPGSGKTRCLTGRIAALIQRYGADPSRICAITFTNKAAREIESRVRRGLGPVAEHLTLGTIHSLCLKLLRPFAKQLGLPPGFGIADEEHQRLVLRRLGVHSTRQGQVLIRFGRRRLEGYELSASEERQFQEYQSQLRDSRLIDYDEILALTRLLLEQDAAVLLATQSRWDHVLIDEFQDLDLTQYTIIKQLAAQHRSVFAVGDDEQSIFSWRGGDPRMIAHFMRDFGVPTSVVLNTNCRCSKAIFDVARRVLRQGELYPRREITARRDSPYTVEVAGHTDESAEANWLTEHLKADAGASGLPFGEYAILYRKHETGERLEQSLIAAGIPCQPGKGRALADDPVVAQVVSSLRLVLDPDSDVEFERLARLVLPEALIAELLAIPGASLREKLRRRAESKTGTDARSCWRLLYQAENLRSLSQTRGDMLNLIDAILSLGIGTYASPLDDLCDGLEDPAADSAARDLGHALLDCLSRSGRVLLEPQGGLEIPLRLMLRTALPSLRAEYLGQDTTRDLSDLVLVPSGDGPRPLAPNERRLPAAGSSAVRELFWALQCVESRSFRKVFPDYVVFDTETTDKDADSCEVVELAAVRVRDGRVVDRFQTLIRCDRPISPGATAVHGYTDADLIDQPGLDAIWTSFRAFVGDSVLVAHNGYRFDVPILKRLTAPWDGLAGVSFFDSLPLAKHLFPTGGLRLEDLAIRFGIDHGRSHHALDDAVCLAHVFERLQDERLRRARVTCLTHLIDALALAFAVEGPSQLEGAWEAMFCKGARRALGRFSTILESYEQETATSGGVCPPVAEVIDRLGGEELREKLRKELSPADRYPETFCKLRCLVSLSGGGTLQENVRSFLDRLALSRSEGAVVDPDRVCLLTIHATKGLEFSRVYVVGVEDFQLPGYYAVAENREDEIHEARRLLYVAMTRAKDRLCLTYCNARNGRPAGGTMFLSEMGLVGNAEVPGAIAATSSSRSS